MSARDEQACAHAESQLVDVRSALEVVLGPLDAESRLSRLIAAHRPLMGAIEALASVVHDHRVQVAAAGARNTAGSLWFAWSAELGDYVRDRRIYDFPGAGYPPATEPALRIDLERASVGELVEMAIKRSVWGEEPRARLVGVAGANVTVVRAMAVSTRELTAPTLHEWAQSAELGARALHLIADEVWRET